MNPKRQFNRQFKKLSQYFLLNNLSFLIFISCDVNSPWTEEIISNLGSYETLLDFTLDSNSQPHILYSMNHVYETNSKYPWEKTREMSEVRILYKSVNTWKQHGFQSITPYSYNKGNYFYYSDNANPILELNSFGYIDASNYFNYRSYKFKNGHWDTIGSKVNTQNCRGNSEIREIRENEPLRGCLENYTGQNSGSNFSEITMVLADKVFKKSISSSCNSYFSQILNKNKIWLWELCHDTLLVHLQPISISNNSIQFQNKTKYKVPQKLSTIVQVDPLPDGTIVVTGYYVDTIYTELSNFPDSPKIPVSWDSLGLPKDTTKYPLQISKYFKWSSAQPNLITEIENPNVEQPNYNNAFAFGCSDKLNETQTDSLLYIMAYIGTCPNSFPDLKISTKKKMKYVYSKFIRDRDNNIHGIIELDNNMDFKYSNLSTQRMLLYVKYGKNNWIIEDIAPSLKNK